MGLTRQERRRLARRLTEITYRESTYEITYEGLSTIGVVEGLAAEVLDSDDERESGLVSTTGAGRRLYLLCSHWTVTTTTVKEKVLAYPGSCPECRKARKEARLWPRAGRIRGDSPARTQTSRRGQFREMLEEASKTEERAWPMSLPDEVVTEEAGRTYGAAQRDRSADETRAREFLRARGIKGRIVGVVVPDLLASDGSAWRCHPDLVVGAVAVEVDSPARRGGGPSHVEGWPAEDTYRDDCLRAAGYQVVRVRLGGLPPVTDSHNVLRDGGISNTVLEMLVEAIGDAERGLAPTTRRAPSPVAASRPSSSLGPITEDKYKPEGCYTFTWRDGEEQTRYSLRSHGRFLFAGDMFVREVGLDMTPKRKWRDVLLSLIPTLPPMPSRASVSRWGGDPDELPFEGDLVTSHTGVDHVGFSSQARDVATSINLWIGADSLSNGGFHWGVEGCSIRLMPDEGECVTVTLNENAAHVGYLVEEVTAIRSGAHVLLVLPSRDDGTGSAG